MIDLPGFGRLSGVSARGRAVRGESVRLRLDPDGCHRFGPAGTPVPAPAAPALVPADSG